MISHCVQGKGTTSLVAFLWRHVLWPIPSVSWRTLRRNSSDGMARGCVTATVFSMVLPPLEDHPPSYGGLFMIFANLSESLEVHQRDLLSCALVYRRWTCAIRFPDAPGFGTEMNGYPPEICSLVCPLALRPSLGLSITHFVTRLLCQTCRPKCFSSDTCAIPLGCAWAPQGY